MSKTITKNIKRANPHARQQNKDHQALLRLARKFIQQYGLLCLLDVCQGTINKILVTKGFVTVDELCDIYRRDIQNAFVREEKFKSNPKSSPKSSTYSCDSCKNS